MHYVNKFDRRLRVDVCVCMCMCMCVCVCVCVCEWSVILYVSGRTIIRSLDELSSKAYVVAMERLDFLYKGTCTCHVSFVCECVRGCV